MLVMIVYIAFSCTDNKKNLKIPTKYSIVREKTTRRILKRALRFVWKKKYDINYDFVVYEDLEKNQIHILGKYLLERYSNKSDRVTIQIYRYNKENFFTDKGEVTIVSDDNLNDYRIAMGVIENNSGIIWTTSSNKKISKTDIYKF